MEKSQRKEGIELKNQERIRTLGEKENYKSLGVLEADTFKIATIKEKITKEYLKRTKKPSGKQALQQKSHQMN